MAKKKSASPKKPLSGPTLFSTLSRRRHRVLILPRLLRADADNVQLRGQRQDNAHTILKKWARLEKEGHLGKKETAVDADFLLEVFGEALGFKPWTKNPDRHELARNFAVPGVGTADGALGDFGPKSTNTPGAVIELKDAGADLDADKFNGRTPVQQCWDYLDDLPGCPWGIVSNFVTVRLYHRAMGRQRYQEFRLQELVDIEPFRDFYCLFERDGLLPSKHGDPPRAFSLLERSENRQREVGDELYQTYSDNRYALIEHLHFKLDKSVDSAIRIAQKIIDRIIFIAFCEDRQLLPEKLIATTCDTIYPFSKVRNPRWRNFLDLFKVIDEGHADMHMLEHGYNGGLFHNDPEVDDLQLDDSWTNFFKTIGTFDFQDEVNVEVLGHLFEKSIAELERLKKGGLFAPAAPNGNGGPVMPKSPERKRFGIYYTPPEFTDFIVQHTVKAVLDERRADLRRAHGLDEKSVDADKPSQKLKSYWQADLDMLRSIKVCDPACGSGAFLIQAYDFLEDEYTRVVHSLCFHDGQDAELLLDAIPDMILADNLYGVDLNPQSVEITQLALWIRSARRGKTLADLSRNILEHNSLVSDTSVDPKAMDWGLTFPAIFGRAGSAGFDCIIGNPPWERMKLQEREFFSLSAPKIAGAVNAATRRQLIDKLPADNPELYARYLEALNAADRTLKYARNSGAYPLTGQGDINTYMVFAELARKIVAPNGRVGLLVPSGISTDHTTKEFFADLMATKALVSLHDFENKEGIFEDVHRAFKFCTLIMTGIDRQTPAADFVFFAHSMDDLDDDHRHIRLSSADIELLNPNTHTCPIFRARRDAELTKAIYQRVPILIDRRRKEGGNPWGVRFVRMFDQTNDAELFHDPAKLAKMGFKLEGNHWRKGKRTFLPLYEAKMIQAYDHRAASVRIEPGNWMRQGQTEATTLVQHQNPEFVAQPRWWVDEKAVYEVRGSDNHPGFLAYKDVTSPTNQRTMIAAMIPRVAIVNSAPLMLAGEKISPLLTCSLLANLNSVGLDFVARQKVGGLHLNFFIVEQLPVFPPDHYEQRCPWQKRQTLEKWISDRVLKLTCTANDMKPLAQAAGFDPPVHKWKPQERIEIMAELDAAFFHLYGINRADAEYILSTFSGLRVGADDTPAALTPVATIMEKYDELREAR
ncbi:MAG: N-6 DNA methylase [Planctomycetes bacterium]|nr:N-6 DNA methylase [Planctomycetota bacterium]